MPFIGYLILVYLLLWLQGGGISVLSSALSHVIWLRGHDLVSHTALFLLNTWHVYLYTPDLKMFVSPHTVVFTSICLYVCLLHWLCSGCALWTFQPGFVFNVIVDFTMHRYFISKVSVCQIREVKFLVTCITFVTYKTLWHV